MKTFKSAWVLGICMTLFLGALGTIDVSEQEKGFNWRTPVPPINKERVENWITDANCKLRDLLITIKDMKDQDILREFEKITAPFHNTYLRYPTLVLKSGNKLGWVEVIWELRKIADTFVDIGLVDISSVPTTAKIGPYTIDYRFDIETSLILNPRNNPGLRGCGLHRTSCDPQDCE